MKRAAVALVSVLLALTSASGREMAAPPGFEGIASFRFLDRFTFGNFGDPGQFGLEQ